jgi:hypothetical protein
MESNYYYKYITYKAKYLKLKSNFYQFGGSEQNKHIIQINHILDSITSKTNDDSPDKINLLYKLIEQYYKYTENNDIPIKFYELNPYQNNELINSINNIKNEIKNIDELLKLREQVYKIDKNSMDNVLDLIIQKFQIKNISDIASLFTSSLLGYNKNHVIYYMVLFRYLLKNKIQLDVSSSDIPYLSFLNLKRGLDESSNLDDFLELIMDQIINYINSFPIKKVLPIIKPDIVTLSKKIFNKEFVESKYIPKIVKLDTKNKIMEFDSGDIKEFDKITYYDLVFILYSLFRIPIRQTTSQ